MHEYVHITLEVSLLLISIYNSLLLNRLLTRRMKPLRPQKSQHDDDAESEIDLTKRLVALQQARFAPLGRPQLKVKK